MRRIKTIISKLTKPMRPMSLGRLCLLFFTLHTSLLVLTSCYREPYLHLYRAADTDFDIPIVDLELEAVWDYEIGYNITYDWKAEWSYGWDMSDFEIFGEIGYTEPKVFNLRRYFTHDTPLAHHTQVLSSVLYEPHFQGSFEWGYWDLLIWNEVYTLDGVQSIHFDEVTSLDSVTAYTNPSMYTSRYQAPRHTNSYYAPEALFSAYDRAIEIDKNLDGFIYDEKRGVYITLFRINP